MASKILLADDSITIQKVVNLTFADEGIDVVAVSNGEMAERRLGEINPDLVLADIFMPGKNGYELCEFIKQSPQFRNIPVVLLVGAFEPFDQVEARRVHADAHLTKPFESRTLVETVRKLITSSGKPITTPLASPAPTDEEVEGSRPLPGVGGVPDTRPLPPPSFSIDLNAMRDDLPPAQAPQSMSAAPGERAEASSPSMPIETYPLDESVFGGSPGDLHLEIQVDSPAHESNFSSPNISVDRASADVLSFEATPAPTDDDADPFRNLFSTDADSVSLETPALETPAIEVEPAAPASSAPLDMEDDGQFMVVDFERVESDHEGGRSLLAFDVNARGISDQGPGDSFEFTPEKYTTGSLEPSASEAEPGDQYIEQPLEEASPGALFAVDDPLGDVLMDAGGEAPEELQSQAATEPAPAPVELSSDPLSDDPLSIEVAPAAPEPEAYSWDQGFDLSPASEAGEALRFDENLSGDRLDVSGDTVEAELVMDSPSADEEVFTSFEAPASQPADEWEDSATGFEISDPGFHPIDADEAEVLSGTDDDFRASSMWSSREASEAGKEPIDIEAVAVEEPPPAMVESSAPVTAAAEPRAEGRQSGALELSPAMLDEIVRRVVAQMSDSVVREIAWEVVPDCVERVIENLTRESLSKNH